MVSTGLTFITSSYGTWARLQTEKHISLLQYCEKPKVPVFLEIPVRGFPELGGNKEGIVQEGFLKNLSGENSVRTRDPCIYPLVWRGGPVSMWHRRVDTRHPG
jgi:hypothetical protein